MALNPDSEIEAWRRPSLSRASRHGIGWHSPCLHHIMNLALIDPFQLAQDSPDALTNDLSMSRRDFPPFEYSK